MTRHKYAWAGLILVLSAIALGAGNRYIREEFIQMLQKTLPASPPSGSNIIYFKSDDELHTLDSAGNERDVVTEDGTQTLSNKTVSDAFKLEDVLLFDQISTPANPSSGDNKLYFKNDDLLYKLDSAGNEVPVGSGTGQGIENYVLNPGAEINASDDITIAASGFTDPMTKGTTEATFSDSYFIATGNSTSNKTVDWDFDTLNAKDYNIAAFFDGRFQLNLDAGSTGTYKVGIHDGTAYVSGTEADLIDGETISPKALFIIESGETYRVRLECTANCDADDTIYIDDLLVNTNPKGSLLVDSGWLTATSSDIPLKEDGGDATQTVTNATIFYKRSGDTLFLKYKAEISSTSGSGNLYLDLSNLMGGLNINQQSTVNLLNGNAYWYDVSDASQLFKHLLPNYTASSNKLFLGIKPYISVADNIDASELAATDEVSFDGYFAITEWSDSTTNLLTDSVIGSNARFSAEIDSTSVAFSGYTVLNLTEVVTEGGMSYNAGTGELTLPSNGVYIFGHVGDWSFGTGADTCNREWWLGTPGTTLLSIFTEAASYTSNVRRHTSTVKYFSKGDVVTLVDECNGTGNSSTGFGSFRDSAYFIKIADVSAGQPVGFGLATNDQAGLVSSNTNVSSTFPTSSSNNLIGEIIADTWDNVNVPGTGTYTNLGSITLSEGTWLVSLSVYFGSTGGTWAGDYRIYVRGVTTSGGSTALFGDGVLDSLVKQNQTTSTESRVMASWPAQIIRSDGTNIYSLDGSSVAQQTIYVSGYQDSGSGDNYDAHGFIQAIRIR